MRAGAGFNATSAVIAGAHSTWHSPVPYLFGGLAAMLGLIAFALLILACSYWKLSGYLERGEGEGDIESDGKPADGAVRVPMAFGEGVVVIMAGDVKPTFLATPISSRASSFGEGKSNGTSEKMDGTDEGKKLDGRLDGDDARVCIESTGQTQELNSEQ